VLVDNPGCAVLCLTSAGMAELSKPRPGGTCRSHVAALWKDAERGLIEIELPTGADAIVLNISVDHKEECESTFRCPMTLSSRNAKTTVYHTAVLREGFAVVCLGIPWHCKARS
jgi:hypothetical protein